MTTIFIHHGIYMVLLGTYDNTKVLFANFVRAGKKYGLKHCVQYI